MLSSLRRRPPRRGRSLSGALCSSSTFPPSPRNSSQSGANGRKFSWLRRPAPPPTAAGAKQSQHSHEEPLQTRLKCKLRRKSDLRLVVRLRARPPIVLARPSGRLLSHSLSLSLFSGLGPHARAALRLFATSINFMRFCRNSKAPPPRSLFLCWLFLCWRTLPLARPGPALAGGRRLSAEEEMARWMKRGGTL